MAPMVQEAQKNEKGIPSYIQFPSPLSPPAAAGPAQLSALGPSSCLQAICRHRLCGAAGTAQGVPAQTLQ